MRRGQKPREVGDQTKLLVSPSSDAGDGHAKKVLGEAHPAVATSLGNLGNVYWSQGKLDEAVASHEQSLTILTEVFGPKHAHLGVAHYNLGLIHWQKGDLDAAEEAEQSNPTIARSIRLAARGFASRLQRLAPESQQIQDLFQRASEAAARP